MHCSKITRACMLSHVQLFVTPWTFCNPARLLCPWNFPGKNTEMGCQFLLQGIFPTQGSTPHLLCLLHWQAGSLPLSHLGSSPIQGRHILIPGICTLNKWLKWQILCYIYVCVLSGFSSVQLCDPMDYSLPGSVCPWKSPGKNTGVGCHTVYNFKK